MQYLSARCDGARDKDGQGFAATDTGGGKRLARLPENMWTEQDTEFGKAMCYKYRKQLVGFGIEWAKPAKPVKRPRVRPWAAVDYDPDAELFVIGSSYSQAVTEQMRAIPGRRWNPENKTNTVPGLSHPAVSQFVQWAEEHVEEFALTDRADTALRNQPAPTETPARVSYDPESSTWVVRFPYDPAMVLRLKDAFPGLARWDKTRQQWHVRDSVTVEQMQQFAEADNLPFSAPATIVRSWEITPDDPNERYVVGFAYDPLWVDALKTAVPSAKFDWDTKQWGVPYTSGGELLERVDALGVAISPEARAHLERTTDENAAVEALASVTDENDSSVTIGNIRLRNYQAAAVAYATSRRRCIIADEPGLGKTFEALAAVHETGEWPALVICPAAVKINWERETLKMFPGRTVHVVYGRPKPSNGALPPADVTIINYDILAHWADRLPPFGSVLVDEAHYVKNEDAQRSEATAEVLASVTSRNPDGLQILLTGTPIPSRPVELVNLLTVIDRMKDFGTPWRYIERYCNPVQNTYGDWDVSGASNLDELGRRLRKICWVRRKKTDVLKELPDKSVNQLVLSPNDQEREMYDSAEQKTISQYLPDPGNGVEEWAAKAAAAELPISQMTALRGLAATTKIPYAIERATDFLEQTDRKLLVFAHHRHVVEAIAEGLDCDHIYGGYSAAKRQRIIDAFQEDPSKRVLVASIGALGIGVTLTAASDVLMVEQDWVPGNNEQAEDRCHRIGQANAVIVTYLTLENSIDEDIWSAVEVKAANIGQVDARGDRTPAGGVTSRFFDRVLAD